MAGKPATWRAVRRRRRAGGAGLLRGRMPDSFVDQPRPRTTTDILDTIVAAFARDDDLIETIVVPDGGAVLDAALDVRNEEAQEDVDARAEQPVKETSRDKAEGGEADEYDD
jgi:hypothetical protein